MRQGSIWRKFSPVRWHVILPKKVSNICQYKYLPKVRYILLTCMNKNRPWERPKVAKATRLSQMSMNQRKPCTLRCVTAPSHRNTLQRGKGTSGVDARPEGVKRVWYWFPLPLPSPVECPADCQMDVYVRPVGMYPANQMRARSEQNGILTVTGRTDIPSDKGATFFFRTSEMY